MAHLIKMLLVMVLCNRLCLLCNCSCLFLKVAVAVLVLHVLLSCAASADAVAASSHGCCCVVCIRAASGGRVLFLWMGLLCLWRFVWLWRLLACGAFSRRQLRTGDGAGSRLWQLGNHICILCIFPCLLDHAVIGAVKVLAISFHQVFVCCVGCGELAVASDVFRFLVRCRRSVPRLSRRLRISVCLHLRRATRDGASGG